MEHITRTTEMGNAHIILVGKSERKRLYGRSEQGVTNLVRLPRFGLCEWPQ